MKSISVRELRHHWPEAEKALQSHTEIVITRDSKPIAKLMRWEAKPPRGKRFSPSAHREWQRKVFGDRKLPQIVDRALEQDRRDRAL